MLLVSRLFVWVVATVVVEVKTAAPTVVLIFFVRIWKTISDASALTISVGVDRGISVVGVCI